ncbi:Protein DEHYDRATION-INDUCED 19 like [Heracleum sosnowskyi]|uniref:Protein DEHYDRATION-INDUCED 19 like n=1 Tax=Heracleum sosnowskyi TaxID=360622 RepID=A0AAD8IMG1_9APIA|nr:Protein DEHYDRATION-INDUCED 19 like [Heracleum sosnowskyi]
MASDAWGRISSSSRRSPFQSDPFSEEEDMEREEELRPEYTCPFCAEDFDMVGLCCHMDGNHAAEAKNGVCPICEKKVGTDLRRRNYRKGSPLAFIRKEMREGNLHNLAGGSNWAAAANTKADPLLSSFMYNPPTNDEQTSTEPRSSEKAPSVEETTIQSSSERKVQQPVLSDKEYEERTRRSKFVQGLLMSTFLDDDDGF